MRAPEMHGSGNDRKTELEDAVFDALGRIYDLPPDQAVESAGFVAGQIAAFLADVARLSGEPAQAERARGALDDLSTSCRELLRETDDTARAASEALRRIEEIGVRLRASPLAIAARLD